LGRPEGRPLLRDRGQNIAVCVLAGRGGTLPKLLQAFALQADADGLNHVTVNLPPTIQPRRTESNRCDFADADLSGYIYALDL
jgi:hypothetical protein